MDGHVITKEYNTINIVRGRGLLELERMCSYLVGKTIFYKPLGKYITVQRFDLIDDVEKLTTTIHMEYTC